MTVINKKFTPPSLPTAPTDYDQRHIDQFQYALRLYFNQLDGYLANLTNLLNTGQTFENITASNINTGNITVAQDANTFNLTAQNEVNGDLVQANRFMGGNYVGNNYMGNNFYGGAFYGDGRYLNVPYNQFESDQDQTGAVATATAVTFNGDVFPDSISIASNTRITFGQRGVYLLTYSLSFTNPTNDRQEIDIWYRYKGTDIAASNSKFTIPQRKSTGANSYLIAVTPYMIDITADNDYVELMWRVTDATVILEHEPAVAASPGVTPAIPATPSAILTVQFISAQFPPVERVAPLGVLGTSQIGTVVVP